MLLKAFLVAFALTLVIVSAANPALVRQHQPTPGGLPEIVQPTQRRGGDTVRMWKRAEIRVIPVELVAADRAELDSLRQRAVQAESESLELATGDARVRERFSRNVHLINALLNYAERQGSDRGKTVTAIEVQKNLNRLQGQMKCELCHTRLAASNAKRTDAK
jgi:hypothetical protein